MKPPVIAGCHFKGGAGCVGAPEGTVEERLGFIGGKSRISAVKLSLGVGGVSGACQNSPAVNIENNATMEKALASLS